MPERRPNNKSTGGGGGDIFAGSGGLFLFLIVLAAIFFSTKSANFSTRNGINVGSPSKVGAVEEKLAEQKPLSSYFFSSSNSNNSSGPVVSDSGNASVSLTDSPYKNKITLYSYGSYGTDPNREYIDIYASYSIKDKIPVTAWSIENSKGEKYVIGSANYLASASSDPGSPILLSAGDTLHIITGQSPLGSNFRTNLCTGYFNQAHTFYPSLREECPRPETEKSAQNLENPCYNYLKNLQSCRTPESPANKVNLTCQNYVNQELTYAKCVDSHKNDSNFFKNEWFVYLGRPNELWKTERETITLRDQNGKIITTYSY